MIFTVATMLVVAWSVLGTASAGAVDPFVKLHRPLRVPHIAAGARCPVTPARTVSTSVLVGTGPVYPFGGFPELTFTYPPQPDEIWYGSAWSGNKILWLGRRSYRGPVLIRGRQLDGPHELRFGPGIAPARELRLHIVAVSRSGWRNWPSYTRLRAEGCYAWQVDGMTFSRLIVFRARRV